MRKVPLLKWDQIHQIVTREELTRLINAGALLQQMFRGKPTFAAPVTDVSVQPLFNEGEIILRILIFTVGPVYMMVEPLLEQSKVGDTMLVARVLLLRRRLLKKKRFPRFSRFASPDLHLWLAD
jgi:hypothetical protein